MNAQPLGCGTLCSHLTEVLGSDAIIITAGQLVHKGQHLVFGSDEFWLSGTTQEEKVRWLIKFEPQKRRVNMWRNNICHHSPQVTVSFRLWSTKHVVFSKQMMCILTEYFDFTFLFSFGFFVLGENPTLLSNKKSWVTHINKTASHWRNPLLEWATTDGLLVSCLFYKDINTIYNTVYFKRLCIDTFA